MTTATVAREAGNALVQAVQNALGDLLEIPPYEAAPDLYLDYGDTEEFKVKLGKGECAA